MVEQSDSLIHALSGIEYAIQQIPQENPINTWINIILPILTAFLGVWMGYVIQNSGKLRVSVNGKYHLYKEMGIRDNGNPYNKPTSKFEEANYINFNFILYFVNNKAVPIVISEIQLKCKHKIHTLEYNLFDNSNREQKPLDVLNIGQREGGKLFIRGGSGKDSRVHTLNDSVKFYLIYKLNGKQKQIKVELEKEVLC